MWIYFLAHRMYFTYCHYHSALCGHPLPAWANSWTRGWS